jgi:GR25 family glycosyltransferase involved in LPS biosynthesis
MEDDFCITPGFLDALRYIEANINEWGFVRMEPLEQRWTQRKNLSPVLVTANDSFRLLYQRMPSVRLTGYAISPKCAHALVRVSNRFAGPVDFVVRRCWVHGQPLFAIDPPVIHLAKESWSPTIKGREKSFVRYVILPIRLIHRYLERQRAVRHSARQLHTPPLNNMLKKMAA